MNRNRSLVALFVLLILAACSTEVDRVNPYDPDTPDDLKAKASLSGRVDLDGFGEVTDVVIVVGKIDDAKEGEGDNVEGARGSPLADGTYSLTAIVPGVHEVRFVLEGYEAKIEVRKFEPGEDVTLNIRLLTLRGGVAGRVELQDQNDHSGVTVALSPNDFIGDIGDGFQLVSLSAPSGDFLFDNVPVGSYSLMATKAGYLGQVAPDVEVTAYTSTTLAETIVLPPVTGAVAILGGPDHDSPDYDNTQYTRTADVLLRVLGFNALQMKVSESPDLAGADWVTYQTDFAYTLSDGDGAKTVYVQLKGQDDILSDRLEGHIILDTQAPRLFDLVLGSGTGYTDDTGIPVRVLADDLPLESGIAEMRIKKGSPPGDLDLWDTYRLDADVILDDLDGPHDVYVQVRDRAGNSSELAMGTVILDRVPPAPGDPLLGPPVLVGNGSGYALGLDVPVSFNIVDATTAEADLRMVVCETEGCPGLALGPYASQTIRSYTAEGSYTVYALFMDGAGNTYAPDAVSFSIDSEAPGFPVVTVVEGSAVNDPLIHLQIDVTGADEMLVSEDASFAGASWQALQSPAAFTLNGDEGQHHLFVKVRDLAGHEVGPGTTVVELDTIPPGGTVRFLVPDETNDCEGTVCYTNSESALVEVAVTSADDPAELRMQLSLDAAFNEPVQLFSPMTTLLLENVVSPQEVHLQLIDRAGNTSSTEVSANQMVLDLVAPTIPLVITVPLGYSNVNTGIRLELLSPSVDNGSGLKLYEFQVEPLGVPWAEYDADGNGFDLIDLPPCALDECTYQFKVRAQDLAGNVSDHAVVPLALDQQAPAVPVASVDPFVVDEGPRAINADAVTVWLQPPGTPDPNFAQYQTRIRTCDGVFDPVAKTCTQWGVWTPWADTGIGAGAVQLQVLLVEADKPHLIQVRGADLAGNLSASDRVFFTEDSQPPTPAVLDPTEAEINADFVSVYFRSHADDPGGTGVAGYECTVNGRYECMPWQGGAYLEDGTPSTGMPASTQRFKVKLEQGRMNVVQVRAIDAAANRSSTSTSNIEENSTLLAMTAFDAEPGLRLARTIYVDYAESSAVESGRLVTTFNGHDVDDNSADGLLIVDLRTGEPLWIEYARGNRVEMKGGRAVVDVSFDSLCTGAFDVTSSPVIDPGDVSGRQLCRCVLGVDCSPYSLALENHLRFGNARTLIMVDLTTGMPVVRWVRSTPGLVPYDHPILGRGEGENLLQFSFDGRRVAWAQDEPILGDGQCRLYAATLPTGCVSSETDCPLDGVERAEMRTAERCGRVAVGDDGLAWIERLGSGATQLMYSDFASGVRYLVQPGAADFDNNLEGSIAFDCVWNPELGVDGEPECDHLLWIDQGSVLPSLWVLDLADPAALLKDRIRDGFVELRHMRAERGRAVWQDFGDGTNDVFLVDLHDPAQCPGPPGNRQCLGNHRIIAGGAPDDNNPALWGDLVAYWRGGGGGGQQLRVLDLASKPWFFIGPSVFMGTHASGGTALIGSIDTSGSGDPNRAFIFDPADGSLTQFYSTADFLFPVSYRALGGLTAVGFLGINSSGWLNLNYCDDAGVDCDSAVDVVQDSLEPVVPGAFSLVLGRGDERRMLWAQQSDADRIAVLDCDMDPAGARPCRAVQAGQPNTVRILFDIFTGPANPFGQRPRVCGIGVGGDHGLLFLVDENQSKGAAYRLDLVALEGRVSPIVVRDMFADPVGEQGVVERLDDDTWQPVSFCHDFETAADADPVTGQLVLLLPTEECVKCAGDNPVTYVNEDCSQNRCCGDVPCVCTGACDNFEQQIRLMLFAPGQPGRVLDSWFRWGTISRPNILDGWVAFQDKVDNQQEMVLVDLRRDGRRRFTYHTTDQSLPTLGQLPGDGVVPGGLQLLWSDSRLGATQIFHTVLE